MSQPKYPMILTLSQVYRCVAWFMMSIPVPIAAYWCVDRTGSVLRLGWSQAAIIFVWGMLFVVVLIVGTISCWAIAELLKLAVDCEGHLAAMRYNTPAIARGLPLPARPVSQASVPQVLADPTTEIAGLESEYPVFNRPPADVGRP